MSDSEAAMLDVFVSPHVMWSVWCERCKVDNNSMLFKSCVYAIHLGRAQVYKD